INGCTIDINANTSTTQSNSAGIVASNSSTSVLTAGNNANNLTISNCTVKGGYQGIIIYGNTGGLNAVNNDITDCTVQDFYSDGIVLNNNNGGYIHNNNIHRSNRVTVTTFTGIELGAGCRNMLVDGNRIHDTHNSASTLTGSVNGISMASCDAPTAEENLIVNNLIYNFNGSTGTYYGIINTGSDGVFFYHNTIVLNNSTSASGTTRGFYQTTAATNIKLNNNIFYVTRAGTGTKHCLYFGTTTSTILSNNNVLYINAPGATTAGVGSFGTANSANLAAWQLANTGTYDLQSNEVDPIFVNPLGGDFTPSSSAVNDFGVPVGVNTDILNTARSLTSPDPGAYEFSLLGTDAEITWVSPAAPFSLGLQPIIVDITNQQAQTISSVNLSYDDGTTIQTENFSGLSIAPTTTQQLTFTTQYNLNSTVKIRAYINSVNGTTDAFQGNDTTDYQFLCFPMSGAYTINSALPTGSGNFNTFNDAVDAMVCAGITGAVTFNVNASSGPYNE
ncbi:MAG TPA: right-handed parallel beta-helix repeat-containing protein, partial [Bacteroidia bacterium]|nr:right-handed parallel beta-helix repeat-containing protein [Bacteroidia bacterium]